jgi:serine/threonine-protein kinase HipA
VTIGLEPRPTATTIDVETLVNYAWEGRIRVPHFQRDYRWTLEDVARLFEMELLGQVGHDLPGGVRVLQDDMEAGTGEWVAPDVEHGALVDTRSAGWRFSLAGVGLKLSMLAVGDRLTLPAFGEGGDWIVKFPDPTFPDVPRNEHTMMLLAGEVGIEVPEVRLVHRDETDG